MTGRGARDKKEEKEEEASLSVPRASALNPTRLYIDIIIDRGVASYEGARLLNRDDALAKSSPALLPPPLLTTNASRVRSKS